MAFPGQTSSGPMPLQSSLTMGGSYGGGPAAGAGGHGTCMHEAQGALPLQPPLMMGGSYGGGGATARADLLHPGRGPGVLEPRGGAGGGGCGGSYMHEVQGGPVAPAVHGYGGSYGHEAQGALQPQAHTGLLQQAHAGLQYAGLQHAGLQQQGDAGLQQQAQGGLQQQWGAPAGFSLPGAPQGYEGGSGL